MTFLIRFISAIVEEPGRAVAQLTETLRIANAPPQNAALTITPTISWTVDTDSFWDNPANWRNSNGVSSYAHQHGRCPDRPRKRQSHHYNSLESIRSNAAE